MPSKAEEARRAVKRAVRQEMAAEAASKKARTAELAAQNFDASPQEIVSKDEAFRRWGAKGKGASTKGRAAGKEAIKDTKEAIKDTKEATRSALLASRTGRWPLGCGRTFFRTRTADFVIMVSCA